MSINHVVHIVYGVKILREKLKTNVHKRGCNHIFRDFNFCPECGKPMWIDEENLEFEPFNTQVLSYFYPSSSDKELIIGFEIERCDGISHIKEPNTYDRTLYNREIKKFFIEHEMNVPHDFEIFVVFHVHIE